MGAGPAGQQARTAKSRAHARIPCTSHLSCALPTVGLCPAQYVYFERWHCSVALGEGEGCTPQAHKNGGSSGRRLADSRLRWHLLCVSWLVRTWHRLLLLLRLGERALKPRLTRAPRLATADTGHRSRRKISSGRRAAARRTTPKPVSRQAPPSGAQRTAGELQSPPSPPEQCVAPAAVAPLRCAGAACHVDANTGGSAPALSNRDLAVVLPPIVIDVLLCEHTPRGAPWWHGSCPALPCPVGTTQAPTSCT